MKILLSSVTSWHEQIVRPFRHFGEELTKKEFKQKQTILALVNEASALAEVIEELFLSEVKLQAANTTYYPYGNRVDYIVVNFFYNLKQYFKQLKINVNQQDCEELTLLLLTQFPEQKLESVLEKCRQILLVSTKFDKHIYSQLSLLSVRGNDF